MLRGRYGKETAREIVQNKTLGQTLVSFGLAKLATATCPARCIVGGGAGQARSTTGGAAGWRSAARAIAT